MNSTVRGNTISAGQLCAVLLVCRFFTLMTYVPLAAREQSMFSAMMALAACAVAQGIMLIPLIALYTRRSRQNNDANPPQIAKQKNRTVGIILAIAYFLFFTFSAGRGAAAFSVFISEFFSANGSIVLYVAAGVTIAAACVCAAGSAEALSRSASVVLFVFLLTAAVTVIFTLPHADISRLECSFSTSELRKAMFADLERSGEVVAAGFAIKYLNDKKDGTRRGLYSFLAIRLVVLEVVFASMAWVMGALIKETDYPMLMLGSFISSVNRFDAVYMLVWSITAVIRTALFVFFASDCIVTVFPRLRNKGWLRLLVCAAVSAAAAAAVIAGGMISAPVHAVLSAGAVALLGFFVPLALLVCDGRRLTVKEGAL